jgi:hypothetical protein
MKAQTIAPEALFSGLSGLPCTTEQGLGAGEHEAKIRQENLDCYV